MADLSFSRGNVAGAPVVVIGAGLGGLCLAQGLRRAGIPCVVYERDPSPEFRRQGYRLAIDSRGDDALRAVLPANLHALFRTTSSHPRPAAILYDEQLVSSVDLPAPSPVNLNVNRFTLRQILLEGIEVHFGKQFIGYDQDSNGVRAHFADGTQASGRMLVGADGVNSAVRQQYLPQMRVRETGLWEIYGKIALTERTRALFDPPMHSVFCMFAAPDKTVLGIAPVDYPEPVAAACARLAPTVRLRDSEPYMTNALFIHTERFPGAQLVRSLSGAEIGELALDKVAQWHPRLRAMVANWIPEATFAVPLRTSVPIEAWEPSAITLVGDAIHAMSSAGASGANTALRDGAALAADLAAGGSDAIARYEDRMRAYGFEAVRMSARRGQDYFGQDPLPTLQTN
ncbi:FAD-dependent oxidoreductase [Nocardia mexicana]|uniref:2-polyprenyl-6-methoxyphenol hydroxylase-like FAD-dependent oxidoreductase n=1 Tax=Nocardia mexicana TaxID=279262 RepID=A0A370HD72_9NOCA|nr:NAD(P)/FAD-dependent oxidoreductase [Nocardia mexicana]RDI55177.1 2-polyprenyl-6-methoxyphenol hydroxylase-like FAD-dependent oxidoreductase [Nocardia mexicana]